jgi:hypothetical protein
MIARAASAALGALLLLGLASDVRAQAAGRPFPVAAPHIAGTVPGAIAGVVRDDRGAPIVGAMVSAVGASTGFSVTDRDGRFTIWLAPGAYVVRAHLNGYVASRAQDITVQPVATATASIALRRATTSVPILAAGVGAAAEPQSLQLEDDPEEPPAGAESRAEEHEVAWRLRHARRGILKEATFADDFAADEPGRGGPFTAIEVFGRTVGSPARLATSFFAETPFSGQVNILTTSSFETPQQLFTSDTLARGIAYARVGAPVGSAADWNIRGALTQSDIAAWILAGSYSTRAPARHRYDVGMSYSTQRYDGVNPLAVRDVRDGSRNVGEVYGFDSWTITPAVVLSYGGRYARYDYLDHRSLLSPRAELSLAPRRDMRVTALFSRRAHAPGAEEFLPPGDSGIWLPPQRTFSSLEPGSPLDAQNATQVAVAIEQDVKNTTLSIRAFHQRVDDQLVTLFGADLPSQPTAKLGHYVVGNAGDAVATGCTAQWSATIAKRIHGSIAYTLASAQIDPAGELRNLLLVAPSAIRPAAERLHDVATSIETTVPETATRVLVLYRVGNGFARPTAPGIAGAMEGPGVDSRFDVQVRQSLPFMNFTSTKWEMLLAVRNFFREASPDQAVYDELMVVRPPKRIVGGVTMHF